MKVAVIIVRSLMGALFVFGSVAFFLKLIPQPEMTGALKTFNDGMNASVYLMPTVKILELICGIALLSGRFVPLALVLISPVVVNIFMVHAFLDPKNIVVAIILVVFNSFLGYAYWEKFKSLFESK